MLFVPISPLCEQCFLVGLCWIVWHDDLWPVLREGMFFNRLDIVLENSFQMNTAQEPRSSTLPLGPSSVQGRTPPSPPVLSELAWEANLCRTAYLTWGGWERLPAFPCTVLKGSCLFMGLVLLLLLEVALFCPVIVRLHQYALFTICCNVACCNRDECWISSRLLDFFWSKYKFPFRVALVCYKSCRGSWQCVKFMAVKVLDIV